MLVPEVIGSTSETYLFFTTEETRLVNSCVGSPCVRVETSLSFRGEGGRPRRVWSRVLNSCLGRDLGSRVKE